MRNNISSEDLKVLETVGRYFLRSKIVQPTLDTEEKMMTVLIQGFFLGFSPSASVNNLEVVQGRITLKPVGMLALIHSSGLLDEQKISKTNEGVLCYMRRKDGVEHSEHFTKEKAQKMGLLQKRQYSMQLENMLKLRAISACARILFPDVISNIYIPEELEPIEESPEAGPGPTEKDVPEIEKPSDAPKISKPQLKMIRAMVASHVGKDNAENFIQAYIFSNFSLTKKTASGDLVKTRCCSTKDLTQDQIQDLKTFVENSDKENLKGMAASVNEKGLKVFRDRCKEPGAFMGLREEVLANFEKRIAFLGAKGCSMTLMELEDVWFEKLPKLISQETEEDEIPF